MIRIAITPAAYEAIRSTLPRARPCGRFSARAGVASSHVEAAVVDRLQTMRGPARRGPTFGRSGSMRSNTKAGEPFAYSA